ncbi:MAG: DUF1206 domain-containing protein [Nostocoides sp.]
MDTSDVTGTARRAGNSRLVEWGARLGYAVSGLLHLLIGWIALRVAWGGGGSTADQSGALGTLAAEPGGKLVLWVAVVGFALLAVWQLTEAVTGAHGAKGSDRIKSASKFVLYAVLAWTALKFASGGGSSSKQQSVDFTAKLMQHSGGRLLVALLGIVIIAVGAYHIYKGWARKFLQDLQEHPGTWATRAGRIGYVAKGIALGVVGVLFVLAAVHKQPGKATGLDGALRTLRSGPFGSWLLSVVALGIAAYGIYCFARSRYTKV